MIIKMYVLLEKLEF